MNDLVKTGVLIALAVVLAGIAYFVRPSQPQLEAFDDVGEPFYAEFVDPLQAVAMEIIDYDEQSGTTRPFKVELKGGRWTIPSHYDYPADGEDRLADTAAAMIDLRKDGFQSDRIEDHEVLGVVDPIDDASPGLTGRGRRVTLRNESGSVLADFIFGREVDGKAGFRYVRLPGKKRTYTVKVDIDPSAKFEDWIDTNLLELDYEDVTKIQVQDYTVDEASGRLASVGSLILNRVENTWMIDDLPAGKEVNGLRVNSMTSALGELVIAGVRPKPAALTSDLRTQEGLSIDLPTQLSLQSKGYFISADGRLLSNEGEVSVGTRDGVTYTLRFGEVLIGSGLAVSAGTEAEQDSTESSDIRGDKTENRYLFVTARFDESLLPPRPESPTDELDDDDGSSASTEAWEAYENALAEWAATSVIGRETAEKLNDRFAAWYYVITGADFQTIRLNLDDILKDATPPGGDASNTSG